MPKNFSQFDLRRKKPAAKSFILPMIELPKISKKNIAKKTAIFAFSSLFLVLILQAAMYLSSARNASGEILGVATQAYSDLNSAKSNLSQQNLSEAIDLFASASENVQLAQERLWDYKALTWITPQGNSADHILRGAGFLAAAGKSLTEALALFDDLKVTSQGVETERFERRLQFNLQVLTTARDLVYQSSNEFNQVGSLPLDYDDTLDKAKQQVLELGVVLDKLIGLETLYLDIFGDSKVYFLIFQNYDEARATGGFIGTYGILKTNQGKISKLEIDSIYDLDGRINELIASPGPFQPEIKRWGIRDANWFADFRTSAKKLLYFFEKGYGTADGTIAVTPKLFQDLLNLVGPIEMPKYDVILTAENFQDIVQYKTSVDYDKKLNEPKKMLADFAPILLDRLSGLKQEQWFQFFQIMQNNLNQRHVLVYSKDPKTQSTIESLGYSGKLLDTEHDYLNIVNSNLGGTKTDLDIKQAVELKSKILSDDSIINTLTISRFNPTAENNRDFMRVLVPLGSEFVSAVGFDEYPINKSSAEGLMTDPDLGSWDNGKIYSNVLVTREGGKTEFAGWVDTKGSEKKSVRLTYLLPFKAGSSHSLLLQKQAGSQAYSFEGTLSMGRYSVDFVTNGVRKALNSLNFRSDSNTDDFFGFVLSK